MTFTPGPECKLSVVPDLPMHVQLYRQVSRPDDVDTSFAALLLDALADASIEFGEDIPCITTEDPRFVVVNNNEMELVLGSFKKMYHTDLQDFERHLFQWMRSEPRETIDGVPKAINIEQAENGWWNVVMGFGSESSDAIRKKIFDQITVFKNPKAQFIQPQNYSVVMASIRPENKPMKIQEAMLRKISACVSPIALGAFGLDISFGSPQKPKHIDS